MHRATSYHSSVSPQINLSLLNLNDCEYLNSILGREMPACNKEYNITNLILFLPACTDGFYGPKCTKSCNCMDVNEVCHKETGNCSASGCKLGFGGQGCSHGKCLNLHYNLTNL